MSFVVQIITHISDKKSIEISIADSLIRKDDFNAANILFRYLLLSYCGYTWYSIFAFFLFPCAGIMFWHISTTNVLNLKTSRNLHSTNIFFCEVECNIIGSSSFISISVRNMPMCQRHTTLTNAYLSTISEHLSALYSKDLPFVTKLFNQRRNEIGITNLMFVRGRLKWDYRCFDIQSASITKCR